jgi:hypothetical protein
MLPYEDKLGPAIGFAMWHLAQGCSDDEVMDHYLGVCSTTGMTDAQAKSAQQRSRSCRIRFSGLTDGELRLCIAHARRNEMASEIYRMGGDGITARQCFEAADRIEGEQHG